jgi:hypothetical protein
MVGHAQVYDEECDPDKDQYHPDGQGYHHHLSGAVWSVDRYTNEDSIIAHK